MSLMITVVIVVINEVLNSISFSLIKWIKFANLSTEAGALVKVMFICYFFNTAIILLLINMNLSEHEPTQFWGFINGQYTDYSPKWYSDVGYQIYQTFLVQMLMPYVFLLIELLTIGIFRGLDTGCTCNKQKTKTKNIH